jgi:hypothetical protein
MSSTNQSDAPAGDVADDEYKSRTGQSEIPVQSDSAKIESTEYDNGGDSDKQLGKICYNSSTFIADIVQRRMRKMLLTPPTFSMNAPVAQRRRLALIPSLLTRRDSMV